VAGVPKPFDEVTDEDTDHLMTEEEREVSSDVVRSSTALADIKAYIEMMG